MQSLRGYKLGRERITDGGDDLFGLAGIMGEWLVGSGRSDSA